MAHIRKYLPAILIKDQAEQEIQALRKKYAIPAWQTAIPLHITLVRPFAWPEIPESLPKKFELTASNHQPFLFDLAGFGRFDNEASVLFAHVIPTAPMERLASDLRQQIESEAASKDPWFRVFTPHVSISAKATRQEVDEYEARLAGTSLAHTIFCDSFALLIKDPGANHWQVMQEFSLGKS